MHGALFLTHGVSFGIVEGVKGGNMKESTRAVTRATILASEEIVELMKSLEAAVEEASLPTRASRREAKRILRRAIEEHARGQREMQVQALNTFLDALLPDES